MSSENIHENPKGFKASKNREQVINILKDSNSPLTVDFIYHKLRDENYNVSLSTIYRIMEKLVQNNIVKKSVIMDDSKARYELNLEKHKHYIICTKCNKMIPIADCPIDELEKNISKSMGFNITGHKLELYGECSSCSS